jgi:hypothetical protein
MSFLNPVYFTVAIWAKPNTFLSDMFMSDYEKSN